MQENYILSLCLAYLNSATVFTNGLAERKHVYQSIRVFESHSASVEAFLFRKSSFVAESDDCLNGCYKRLQRFLEVLIRGWALGIKHCKLEKDVLEDWDQ